MSDNWTLLEKFHDTDFEIIDHNGMKWVTAHRVGQAIGYSDGRQVVRLINRNKEEFQGKACVVDLTTEWKGRPASRSMVCVSYHGIIRIAMLSNAPRAAEFRDWAESVLYPVMTEG